VIYLYITWVPTTIIWGNWMASAPTVLNTSCNLLITGINASMFYEMNIHSFDSQYSNDESNLTICPFPQAFCCQNEYDDKRTLNSSSYSKNKFKPLRTALMRPRIRDNYKYTIWFVTTRLHSVERTQRRQHKYWRYGATFRNYLP